jgi:acetyl esterase/lipase
MAQSTQVLLWPEGQVPLYLPSDVEEKHVTTDGILRISGVTVPSMSVYLPPADRATGAAVLICPGGGYTILAASHEGSELAEWFVARGIAAFVLKYRLPNDKAMQTPHKVPLMDAMQAMKLIRQNAASYRIDPSKIGVMGFSAGGHLASTLSTHYHLADPQAAEASKPNFAILLYPVITFASQYAHGGSRDKLLGKEKENSDLIIYYSNEYQVSEKTPPTLLVHAGDDKAVPVENSMDYYLALKRHNVEAELHVYPKGGHGFSMRTAGKGSVEQWPSAMEMWLKSRGLLDRK